MKKPKLPKAGASLATIQRFNENVDKYKKAKSLREQAKKKLDSIR